MIDNITETVPKARIYRPAPDHGTKLTVQLPATSYFLEQLAWMRRTLGPRVPIVKIGPGRYEVAAHHVYTLSTAAASRYGSCQVTIDSHEKNACTAACQLAQEETRDTCTCVCGGLRHGGDTLTGWDWTSDDGQYLVEWALTRHVTVINGKPQPRSWSLLLEEKA